MNKGLPLSRKVVVRLFIWTAIVLRALFKATGAGI